MNFKKNKTYEVKFEGMKKEHTIVGTYNGKIEDFDESDGTVEVLHYFETENGRQEIEENEINSARLAK